MTLSHSTAIDTVEGTAIFVRGHNIDTDRIIPARFLKSITFEGLGDHVFEDDRVSMPDHPFSNPRYGHASILITNDNFGSGSSREHAPQALKRWGISACVSESFSEIFRGNALAIGLPCATAATTDVDLLMQIVEKAPETALVFSVSELSVRVLDHTIALEIPAGERQALLNGQWDATGLLLDRFEQVRAIAEALPYVKGF